MRIFLLCFLIFSSWDEVKKSYKNVKEVYSRFKEVILTEDIPLDTLEGELYVKRPDFLKMVVHKPETQIIYSTIDSTLVYLPSWNQIQIFTTPKFVADFFLLDVEKYADSIYEKDLNGIKIWEFLIKKDLRIPYNRIKLTMDKTGDGLKVLSLYKEDVEFRFIFEVFEKNPGFKKEVFEVSFPKGVQRIKIDSLTNK